MQQINLLRRSSRWPALPDRPRPRLRIISTRAVVVPTLCQPPRFALLVPRGPLLISPRCRTARTRQGSIRRRLPVGVFVRAPRVLAPSVVAVPIPGVRALDLIRRLGMLVWTGIVAAITSQMSSAFAWPGMPIFAHVGPTDARNCHRCASFLHHCFRWTAGCPQASTKAPCDTVAFAQLSRPGCRVGQSSECARLWRRNHFAVQPDSVSWNLASDVQYQRMVPTICKGHDGANVQLACMRPKSGQP